MDFDSARTGSGTAEWAEVTVNICRGCANDCLYCYAAANAARFNQRSRAEWSREELTRRAAMTTYPARAGVVMFPSSHDITPFNLAACIRVAKLILQAGNRLLIVTKPRLECVDALVVALAPWKEQILFRFTIGTLDADVSRFWEPGAPLPAERVMALTLARNNGYATSVSIEPMLGWTQAAVEVVRCVGPLVTETIWIGKMNRARLRVSGHDEAVRKIETLQSDEMIMELYRHLARNPMIRWKDSIKEVVGRPQTNKGGKGHER